MPQLLGLFGANLAVLILAAETLPVPAQFGAWGFSISLTLAWGWLERKERIRYQDRLFELMGRTESTTVPLAGNVVEVLRELQPFLKDK